MAKLRRSRRKYELLTAKAPNSSLLGGPYVCRLHDGTAQGKVVSLWKRNGRNWGFACEDCFVLAAPDFATHGLGMEYAMRIDVSFARDLKNSRRKQLGLA